MKLAISFALSLVLTVLCGTAFGAEAAQEAKAVPAKKEMIALSPDSENAVSKALKDGRKRQSQFPQSILGTSGGGAETAGCICCATAGDYGVICWHAKCGSCPDQTL
jgi:hypothetical protein